MNHKEHIIASFVLAAAIVATAFCACAPSDRSEAAYTGFGTIYEVDVAPGFSWSYTPTYPSGLAVTTTIHQFESAGINASMSGNTLNVTVKNGTTSGSFDIVLKATTNTGGIAQTAYQHIRINVVTGLTVSGTINNIISGAAINFTPAGTSNMGSVTWAVKSGTTLPAGLSLSNGTVSGTPTGTGVKTVSLTATAAGESKDLVVSFTVYSKIVGGTAQTITSHGNAVSSTAIVNGSDIGVTWAVTSGTMPSGFTLNSSTGVVSGSSTAVKTTTLTLTGTSGAGPSQTATKTVTVRSEAAATISGPSSVVVYPGIADRTLTFTGPTTSAKTWSVDSATGVSISNTGVVTVTDDASSGNVTVRYVTAYGQTATKTLTIVKEATAAISGPQTLSKITTGESATATLTSNVAGTWTIADDNSPTGTTVAINNGTLTLSGQSPTGAFTVIVNCTTPGGQVAVKTVTCQIVNPLTFVSVPSSGVIAYEL